MGCHQSGSVPCARPGVSRISLYQMRAPIALSEVRRSGASASIDKPKFQGARRHCSFLEGLPLTLIFSNLIPQAANCNAIRLQYFRGDSAPRHPSIRDGVDRLVTSIDRASVAHYDGDALTLNEVGVRMHWYRSSVSALEFEKRLLCSVIVSKSIS